jgi:hypothetical protein
MLIAAYDTIKVRIAAENNVVPSLVDIFNIFERNKAQMRADLSKHIQDVLKEIQAAGKTYGQEHFVETFVEILLPNKTFSQSVAEELSSKLAIDGNTAGAILMIGREYYDYLVANKDFEPVMIRDDGMIFLRCWTEDDIIKDLVDSCSINL